MNILKFFYHPDVTALICIRYTFNAFVLLASNWTSHPHSIVELIVIFLNLNLLFYLNLWVLAWWSLFKSLYYSSNSLKNLKVMFADAYMVGLSILKFSNCLCKTGSCYIYKEKKRKRWYIKEREKDKLIVPNSNS